MKNASENLWPSDLVSGVAEKSPLIILQEQAKILGDMTSNVIEGKVSGEPVDNNEFFIRFRLLAPILGNYQYELLRVVQPIELYPVKLFFEDERREVGSEQELKQYLADVFSSPKTRRIINSLISQSKAIEQA